MHSIPTPASPLQDPLKTHLARLPGEAGWAARNLHSGRTLIHNPRRFLAASTIKLPLLAVYAPKRHDKTFSSPYVYDPADDCEDSPCFEQLAAGTAVSWEEIADWMMIRSDNTATNLLIDRLGMGTVQAWIKAQGWQEMQLNRRMMDLAARARGIDNWTNPTEMMELMERLARRNLLPVADSEWMLGILHRCEDREKIPFLFDAGIQVANKPGELPGTRSDVGYVHDGRHEVVMALFCDGLPDEAAEIAADLWLAELAQLLWTELTA
ncbi:MAG: serine hydrolase [Candidatus Sericytochromatia bacterium]